MVSHWVGVKFASMTSQDVRVGALTADQARHSVAEFDALVAASLYSVTPGAHDFALAHQWFLISRRILVDPMRFILRLHTTIKSSLLQPSMNRCWPLPRN
jgi:hypothetical protein